MSTTSEELQYTKITRIAGQGEDYAVDVAPELGKNALVVSQPCLKSSVLNGKIVVGSTAVELKYGGSRLANRQSLTIQPVTGKIFIGDSGVTVSGAKQGVEISNKQIYEIAIQNVPLYAIAASNTDVIVFEGA